MIPDTKTPIGRAWIDEHGILWHRVEFSERISREHAEETLAILAEMLGGRRAPVISDISQVHQVDPGARDVFARLGEDAPETAIAILVRPGENPASGVQAYLFSALKPDRPVAVFEDEAEAIAWAKEFLPRA
jgi:hypothetical protein